MKYGELIEKYLIEILEEQKKTNLLLLEINNRPMYNQSSQINDILTKVIDMLTAVQNGK